MRQVKLDAIVNGATAGYVFHQVLKFQHYPALAPHVRSTTVHATLPEPAGSSSWELHFRSGLLRWTERDEFHEDELRIVFTQTEGDFDEFGGHWQLRQDGENTVVSFRCDFDFGIPSLAGILDPIAERVIRETVAWAVTGLLDQFAVEFDEQDAPVPAPTGNAG
ncbi:type II toxin-antitoxin system RatA family toxin [Actinoplanes sp. N902-109]|uniref:type II toxin-antitoxin system RatA family toxin n=1 Tax=Actinoplanes sp. (strain N902-109) TaxID=649831 RepID=UPI0003294B5F|nr:SRPBCC family protein [Actinoplanes sp. N902-109]AGL15829.1 cyclase/dehydrase [Actinoplanes sp. N902-109]